MLSHLRLHRRAPSNPSSPVPGQLSPLEPSHHDFSPNARPSSASNATSLPPTLPPIPRVTSESDLSLDLEPQPPEQPMPRRDYSSDSSFIGGVALQKYREQTTPNPAQPASAAKANGSSANRRFSAQRSAAPPPINTAVANHTLYQGSGKQGKVTPSFVTPTDLQVNASSRLTHRTEQPAASAPDPPKPKKGFLRNPVSNLLARRKTAQNVPDLSLPLRVEEPAYDPRIRGTRVHDFSAPRPRKIVSTIETVPTRGSQLGQEPDTSGSNKRTSQLTSSQLPDAGQQRSKSSVSTSSQSTSGPPGPTENSAPVTRRPASIDRNPVLNRGPPVPPKDDVASSQTTGSRPASVDVLTMPKSTPSTRTNRSRNISLSEVSAKDIVFSAVPKHMKSTSSRFSFDMIGAAGQEKLLEERHRQRQQEKEAEPAGRDSRFDDFDDEFDYDPMDFDDDLEERIPGVNADFDELEEDGCEATLDPDNDQENFAGFVFQRSNPASSLTSPHSPAMLATPRDADGKIIGFAMTKDAPEINSDLLSPAVIAEAQPKLPQRDGAMGLGIHRLAFSESVKQNDEAQAAVAPPPSKIRDELYFDGGIDEFAGEDIDGDGEPFDESIFDLNDTDQFGRPLPGVFAQHLSMRKTLKEQKKRESDMTSRLSGQSGASESTHTSLSAQPQHVELLEEPSESTNKVPKSEEEASPKNEVEAPPNSGGLSTEREKIAAYQAALAAAACQAAASGKFRRDSDPPLLAELMITSPTTTASSQPGRSPLPPDYEDDEYDGFANDFDDYDFDDEAMVAEANASALANDSDGFYGQEFGFYSVPINPGSHHGHSSQLSAENLYQYANGGFFGPAGGVNRAASGRIVSREPNLTPITERSEYSNRNSIMSSLGIQVPGGPNPLASPGLAQLAMLADDAVNDTMSLSALLKLRSRAWGGSQASLASSRDGSPRSETCAASPWGGPVLTGASGVNNSNGGMPLHARKGSTFSILSRDSEPGSGSASPTLAMSLPLQQHQQQQPQQTGPLGGCGSPNLFSPQPSAAPSFPPVLEDEEPAEAAGDTRPGSGMRVRSPDLQPVSAFSSPVTTAAATSGGMGRANSITRRPPAQGQGHRKRGSQGSISYMKEKEEESGETRWVVERRRTAESGEVEILEREVLRQGRI